MQVVNRYNKRPLPATGTVNIMRPTVFGNPFVLNKHGDRAEVIAKFEAFARNSESVMQAIYALKEDAVLVCCCKPRACHGDVIAKLWHEMHTAKAEAVKAEES